MATFRDKVRGSSRFVALCAVLGWSVATYGLCRSCRRGAVARARWLQVACRRALRVLAVRVESRGDAEGGAVIVANHLSYLDVLVVASLKPVVFVSKKEVRDWPLFGWFAVQAGTCFIDRNRRRDVVHVGEEFAPVQAAGLMIVLFLEGTTSDGSEVLPLKTSLLEPAVRNGWRVVPTGLRYRVPADRSVEREVCWWGDMTLVPHLLNLTTLPWISAHVVWGSPLETIVSRHACGYELRARISDLREQR